MIILITGASGDLGRALIRALQSRHTLHVLGRTHQHLTQQCAGYIQHTWDELPSLDAHTFDAIIHLAGFNLSSRRWTSRIKKMIIDSRVNTTEALSNWLISQQANPKFLCANAVGIYGAHHHTETYDEDSLIQTHPPLDFLSEIGLRWQAPLEKARRAGIPVISTRFGVVLKKQEGFLKKIFPSFYLGLGSRLGDGQQYLSWIHHDDFTRAMMFLLETPDLTGVFNLTAPNPVPQATFANIFAKVLHRPCFFTMPAWLIRLLFGEMGDDLLLRGQRVIPKRLLSYGFKFQYPELTDALKKEFLST